MPPLNCANKCVARWNSVLPPPGPADSKILIGSVVATSRMHFGLESAALSYGCSSKNTCGGGKTTATAATGAPGCQTVACACGKAACSPASHGAGSVLGFHGTDADIVSKNGAKD